MSNDRLVSNDDLTPGRAMLGLGLIYGAACVYGWLFRAPCDDAYIFYVYAKNFVQGNGVTFNGMIEWGFTSVGWQALLCVVGLFRVPLPIAGEILSAASGAFALGSTYFLGRCLSLTRRHSLMPPLLLALTGDFAFYMFSGLEQVAYTGLVALCAALVLREPKGGMRANAILAFLMSLMILVRPEGALISGVLLMVLAIRVRSMAGAVRSGLMVVLTIGPILVGLRMHFGDWLPNTYYVKSGVGFANVDQGLHYLAHSVYRYGIPSIVALVVLKRLERGLAPASEAFILLGISAIWVAYVVIQGGDNMVGGRQLIPILPLCYAGFARFCAATSVRRLAPGIVAVAVALVLSYSVDPRVARQTEGWRSSFKVRRNAGLYLRDNFSPATTVALNPAGIIPYFSELPTIDMLGLNNHVIARGGKRDLILPFGHQVGDGDYVLSQKPEVILFGGSLDDRPASYISDRELGRSSKFRREYRRVQWEGIGTAYIRN